MNTHRAMTILDQILSEYPRDIPKRIRLKLATNAVNRVFEAHATHLDFRMTQADVFIESYLEHQVKQLIGA
jgi:hypothetical protein